MTPLTPSALPDLQTPAHPSSHRKSPLATALLAALALSGLMATAAQAADTLRIALPGPTTGPTPRTEAR